MTAALTMTESSVCSWAERSLATDCKLISGDCQAGSKTCRNLRLVHHFQLQDFYSTAIGCREAIELDRLLGISNCCEYDILWVSSDLDKISHGASVKPPLASSCTNASPIPRFAPTTR